MDESTLIETYFVPQRVTRPEVVLGIGDDAAVVAPRPGMESVVTADLLVEGTHFEPGADPGAVGHKALAVNLSDLAAMGAEPAWAVLTLSLPQAEPEWLGRFSRGLFALAAEHDVQLVGGDTVRGPLALGVLLGGWVPEGAALRRSGAQPGDAIYVTGEFGAAALALKYARGELPLPLPQAEAARKRLERPVPRVREGMALRGLASAAIDVSDGLAADLSRILAASGVGGRVELAALPLDRVCRSNLEAAGGWDAVLGGGEDYELCFTVPPERLDALAQAQRRFRCKCTCIGRIEARPGLRFVDPQGGAYRPERLGYDHFGEP